MSGPGARKQQRRIAEELKASGALDGLFAQMDAGTPLTGQDGLASGVVKAALERGLDSELAEHLGYERGDPDAAAYPNSRRWHEFEDGGHPGRGCGLWTSPGTGPGPSPRCWCGRGQRRLDGLDGMIISLYAGGMTVRDIQHHLAQTIGTEPVP